MKRSDRNARTNRMLTDLDCARTADQQGGWRHRLEQYAEKGYPTGSDNAGGGNTINRPTERLALMPDTPPASKLKRLEEIEQALSDLAREYHSIYQWTINSAKYDGPEARACIVLGCDREISMIGSDIARNGRCPRCAQHLRRHGTEYPHKLERNDARAS
jgi:hypothetical protein